MTRFWIVPSWHEPQEVGEGHIEAPGITAPAWHAVQLANTLLCFWWSNPCRS
ncbi:MAG TPA: hypothetical protein VNH14_15520 [Gemmatimonadales bacterium]|nr:hypothetical protein [Gemmatimonadales bacterium]